MTGLWDFVLRHGYGLMGLCVFVEQLGAPIPAIPVLMVMGALAGLGFYSVWLALFIAVLAALLADLIWFALGRRRGDSILGLLCRFSLEPGTCVTATRTRLDRWGPATLIVAKFIPGLSTVAPPLAGSSGLPLQRFVWLDSAGSALWAGSALTLGFVLRREVQKAVDWLEDIGAWVLPVVMAPLAIWLIWKYLRRESVMRRLRVARIKPKELQERMQTGEETYVVDLRSPGQLARSRRKLPGALTYTEDELNVHLRDLPRGAHLVFYCT